MTEEQIQDAIGEVADDVQDYKESDSDGDERTRVQDQKSGEVVWERD